MRPKIKPTTLLLTTTTLLLLTTPTLTAPTDPTNKRSELPDTSKYLKCILPLIELCPEWPYDRAQDCHCVCLEGEEELGKFMPAGSEAQCEVQEPWGGWRDHWIQYRLSGLPWPNENAPVLWRIPERNMASILKRSEKGVGKK